MLFNLYISFYISYNPNNCQTKNIQGYGYQYAGRLLFAPCRVGGVELHGEAAKHKSPRQSSIPNLAPQGSRNERSQSVRQGQVQWGRNLRPESDWRSEWNHSLWTHYSEWILDDEEFVFIFCLWLSAGARPGCFFLIMMVYRHVIACFEIVGCWVLGAAP